MKMLRPKEWWMDRARREGVVSVGAGIPPANPFESAVRRLVFMARTSGGTAGRDQALCNACEEVEKFLEAKSP